jgi:hypothetical protein
MGKMDSTLHQDEMSQVGVSIIRRKIFKDEMSGVGLDRLQGVNISQCDNQHKLDQKYSRRSIAVEISLGHSVDGRSVKAPIHISTAVRWYAKTSALPCCVKY